ncbi:hypothetical protein LR69_01571 [Geobacillus sp. BCO2]|nr:hypothetical protein LR69_01571 [Geobacillus sp. BCO2]
MNRSILASVLLAFLLAAAFLVSFFYLLPPGMWPSLWEQTVMGLPFLLFVLAVSLCMGIGVGWMLDSFFRRQWQAVVQALRRIEQGEMGELHREEPPPELQDVWQQIEKLQTQWLEQTKRVQKIGSGKGRTGRTAR